MFSRQFSGIGAGFALSAVAAGHAGAVITPTWTNTASSESGYIQNDLQVLTSLDWISTQLLVELSHGQFFYVSEGVVPSLNPTLLVGATANTSQTFPAGGNPNDPLNSQIPGFGLIPNVGTGGAGGLGGSATAVIDLDTFDLTYFGPPTETDDVATVTPLTLAQMTVSDDAFGSWALRLRNSDPNDPENQPAETLYANGYVFAGIFFEGTYLPGDTDNDGDVDDSDLGTSFANYTGPIGVAGAKTPAQGDTDGDGDIDDSDLGTSFSNYTGPLTASLAVPEPTTSVLFFVASAAFGVRRRRYSRG